MVGKDVRIVLQVLPHLLDHVGLEQWAQLLKYLLAIELPLKTRVNVSQGYISGLPWLHSEGHAHNLSLHVIKAGGLSIKCKQWRVFKP